MERKTVDRTAPIDWTKEDSAAVVKASGVSPDGPFRFKINLCNDGTVVTRDGECIGTWEMDENSHPSFYPDDASVPAFFDVFMGSLCEAVRKWHEERTGDVIS